MLHEVMNIVKYTKSDFLAAPGDEIYVDFEFSDPEGSRFANTPIKALPECHIEGVLQFDGRSKVVSSLHYEGVMTVEDSITGEDLDLDFETDSEKEYSFDAVEDPENSEIIPLKRDTLDLDDEALEAIVFEAPMSITRLARDKYPQGEGWVLVSDQDEPDDTPKEDPRWAKLKDLHFEDN